MDFKTAYNMPIGDNVEKKGRYSYLSWAFAVRHLRENFPTATWRIHTNSDGVPVICVGDQAMVAVSIIIEGQDFTQYHPVLNGQNKPIANPGVFDINTSIQRCLTKAIALATGIGLGLYAGEDLPVDGPKPQPQTTLDEMMDQIDEIAKLGEIEALVTWYKNRESLIRTLNEDEQSTIINTLRGTRALLEEQSTPVHEAEIICPNGVSGVTDAECAKCAGREGCPAHK